MLFRADHRGNRGLGLVHVQLYNMKFLTGSFKSFAYISVRFCPFIPEILCGVYFCHPVVPTEFGLSLWDNNIGNPS